MKTPLVCRAFAPGTPNNPLDVLDLTTTDGEIRLTIRREGKLFLNQRWNNDKEGRECAAAMAGDMVRHGFRPPTDEELRTVPDLQSAIEDSEPEDPALCLQWDIDGRDPDDALDLRNRAIEWAEALLDDAGLLIDWEGASIGSGTVETTFSVSDFDSAKRLLLSNLPKEYQAHNCRIFDERAG